MSTNQIYTYIPSEAGNLALAVYFGIIAIVQIPLGISYRTWTYLLCMFIGCVLEVLGYAARLLIRNDPSNSNGFAIYLITNTIAPVFLAAAVYLCSTRVIVLYGQHLARVRPKAVAVGFMVSDIFSLLLQAAGAAIASSDKGTSKGQTGIDVMIAGLIFQVISLALFLLVCADFAWRCYRGKLDMAAEKVLLRHDWKMKTFLCGLLLATVCILIRSIYRAIELSDGFTGSLWNSQTDFMVLDGGMIGLAVLCQTPCHPGVAFCGQWSASKSTFRSKSVSDTEESDEMRERSPVRMV